MLKRAFFTLPVLAFAFFILLTSVLRTASVKYEFSRVGAVQNDESVLGDESSEINYYLAYPGKVLPDSPLWPVKALRDRVWLMITTNPSRKAELKLLFADKRIGMSRILFEKGKCEVGFSTLTKAEKYLEEAGIQEGENREKGIDTSEFLLTLYLSSLKHQQVINDILKIAPEDARPNIIQAKNYPEYVGEKARQALNEKGISYPESPFDGD